MTDDLKERLLPCPFCGGQMENRGYGAIHVAGTGCPIGDLAVDVTKWNTRAPDPASSIWKPASPPMKQGGRNDRN